MAGLLGRYQRHTKRVSRGGKPPGFGYRKWVDEISSGKTFTQLQDLGFDLKDGEHWFNKDGTLRMSDVDTNPTNTGGKTSKASFKELWLDDKIATRAHNVPWISDVSPGKSRPDGPDLTRVGNRLKDRRMGAFMGKSAYDNYLKQVQHTNTHGMLGSDYRAKYKTDMDQLAKIAKNSGLYSDKQLAAMNAEVEQPLKRGSVNQADDVAESRYLRQADKEARLQPNPRRPMLTMRGWKPQYYEPSGTKINQAGHKVDSKGIKGLKGAGKLGVSGLLGAALDYLVPENPISGARDRGWERLREYGILDLPGKAGITTNDPVLNFLTGIFADPLVTAFGAGDWIGTQINGAPITGQAANPRAGLSNRNSAGGRNYRASRSQGLIPSS